MQIRACDPGDHDGIDALLKSAFPTPAEARLVTALRAADADTLELVADDHGRIAGAVMFSPVTAIAANGSQAYGAGLGPVAVIPEHQRRGIGTALIEAGLDYLRQLGAPWCVVLGDPAYYGRFGFKPASGQDWSWAGDPDGEHAGAFQWLSLSGKQPGTAGPCRVHYHPAFDTV
jgi:putative acetyltransferase